jgi:type I restriction enzyme S subunit
VAFFLNNRAGCGAMTAELDQIAATGAPASGWKPYPAYKDSGVEWIGRVPEHWEIKKLKYIAEIILGKMLTNDDNGGYFLKPYLRAQNINWQNVNSDDIKEMWFSKQELKQYRIKLHDLLISEGGEVGRTAIWKNEIEECYIQNSVHKVTMLPGNNPFYYLSLFFLYGQLGFFDSIVSRVSIAHLTKEKLKEVFCFVPPFPEQRAISIYLDDHTQKIDTLIEKKQKLNDLLKEERSATINQAVTKGLNPEAPMKDSGIEWLGEIPKHWGVKKLKNVVKGKLKYGANESAEFEDVIFPRYIRITDFGDDGKLREDTFKSLPFEIAKEYLLEKGDILFARSGATVGKTFQFKNYQGLACFAGYLIKASPDESKILSDYLYLFTKSNVYENWKNSIFIQATIQNIGADKYNLLQITSPSIEEQKSIVQLIESEYTKTDRAISRIEKEIALLQEYRTSLISEVVTGKIDVREAL